MTPRLDMIGLVAHDLARTLAFYRQLGLDIPAGAETDAHVEITLPGGVRLAWDSVEVVRSLDPGYQPGQGGGASLAFLCDSPAEVDRRYAEMTGAGFAGHREPWDAEWGQRYALLRDPDGTAVDLFAPLKTGD